MRHLSCAAVTIAFGLIAAPLSAQSLGDLARQEEARRATAKKSVKSFSNADLAPSEIAPITAAAPAMPGEAVVPCDPGVSKDKCAAPEEAGAKPEPAGEPPAQSAAEQEAAWRRNADEIRRQLAKARTEYDLVAARAADPARPPGERATAERLAALQQDVIDGIEGRWERLENQVRELKLPSAWLNPRPTLSIRIPQ